jgi:hypothetical protein
MKRTRHLLLPLAVLFATSLSLAAPDEASLGKASGYPVASSFRQAYQEPYIVGSFSAMDSFNPSCALAPSDQPRALMRGIVAAYGAW